MISFTKALSVISLTLIVATVSLAQEKTQSPQVKAKDPTVVTVHGTQSQVDTAVAAQSEKLKERSLPAKIGSGIVKSVKKAFHFAFDWTEDSLGVNDDIDPKKPKEK